MAPGYLISIVDDDNSMRDALVGFFRSLGYAVRCAEDGFEALAMVKEALPDIIICDLNMPRMSGFELLSVVRRRFPQIPVVALSGDYSPNWHVGVIADVYLQKGEHSPGVLVEKIRDLLDKSPLRANIVKSSNAPVWIPIDGKPYFVLTCVNCLRSFSLPAQILNGEEKIERNAKCEFCETDIAYVLDAGTIKQVRRAAE